MSKKRFTVQFEPGMTQSQRKRDQKRCGVVRVHRLRTADIEVVDAESVEDVKALQGVMRVVQDKDDDRFSLLEQPYVNDPFYEYQWGHHIMGIESAWDMTKGSAEIVVGVVDSGVDFTHADLTQNMWVNPADPSGVTRHGISALGPVAPIDGHGHGTHVAGIIGAVANNEMFIAGVNHHVRIMSLQIFNAMGRAATFSNIVRVMDWGIDHGCNILSNSWGGAVHMEEDEDEYNIFADLVGRASSAGVLVVAAAGNAALNHDALRSHKFIPSDVPGVVSIAASTVYDTMARFSDYGTEHVHVAAPGQDILSLYPGQFMALMSGTSMATPYASGLCALWMSKFSRDPDIVKAYLLGSSTTKPDMSAMIEWGGRIDAKRMFEYPTDQCPIWLDPVTNVVIEGSETEDLVNILTWDAPPGTTVIVCASAIKFPQEPGDDVIYTGTEGTCIDTVEDRLSPKYYTLWAKHGFKYSLPVRKRHGNFIPFFCPIPPPGYDFICNFHDELVLPFDGLLDADMYAQLWRGSASKQRTWQSGYAYGGILDEVDPPEWDGEVVMFDGYDTRNDYDPTGADLLDHQHRGKVSGFLRACIIQCNEFRKETELFSKVFNKKMLWTWLDYWRYREKGKISTWEFPVEFNDMLTAAEDKNNRWFDRPQNWQKIVTMLKTIIHHCRVLYCTEIPWFFADIRSDSEVWLSDKLPPKKEGEFRKIIPIDDRNYRNEEPPMKEVLVNIPGEEPQFYHVYNVTMNSYTKGKYPDGIPVMQGILANPEEMKVYFFPRASGKNPYYDKDDEFFGPDGPERFRQFSTFLPYWLGTERLWFKPLSLGNLIKYQTTTVQQLDFESFDQWTQLIHSENESPPPVWIDDPPPDGYVTRWRYRTNGPAAVWEEHPIDGGWLETLNAAPGGIELNGETYNVMRMDSGANMGRAKRTISYKEEKMVLPDYHDWVRDPVRFTVTLIITVDWASPLAATSTMPEWALGKVMPAKNTDGHLVIRTKVFDEDYTLHVNPTEVYSEGGVREIELHQEIVDTDGVHKFDWASQIELSWHTLKSLVLDDLEGAEDVEPVTWHAQPRKLVRQEIQPTMGGRWIFVDVKTDDSDMIVTSNKTVQRSMAVGIGYRIFAEIYNPGDEEEEEEEE